METSQFEGKKIALKQTKDGYAMTLAIHPDDVPDELLRDFVGARYMVVMVRLDDNEQPLNREEYAGAQMVKLAGMLCRDPEFWEYLHEEGSLFQKNEKECVEWMQNYLVIESRSELKTNMASQQALKDIYAEYKEWKQTRNT
jgi:hypothetical protein